MTTQFGRVEIAGFIPVAVSELFGADLYKGDNRPFTDEQFPDPNRRGIRRDDSRFFVEIDFVKGSVMIQVNPTRLPGGECAGSAWPIELGPIGRGIPGPRRQNKFDVQVNDLGSIVVSWSVVHGDRRVLSRFAEATRVPFDGSLRFFSSNRPYELVGYRGDCFPSVEAYSFAPDGSRTTIFKQATKHPAYGVAIAPRCPFIYLSGVG